MTDIGEQLLLDSRRYRGRLVGRRSSWTISRTSLGRLQPGDPVNLERAVRSSDRLGGHMVKVMLMGLAPFSNRTGFTNTNPEKSRALLCGERALNGGRSEFDLFRHQGPGVFSSFNSTYPRSNHPRTYVEGDNVNLEVDVIAKYVERLLAPTLKASVKAPKRFRAMPKSRSNPEIRFSIGCGGGRQMKLLVGAKLWRGR